MAVRTKEELMQAVRAVVGEDTGDASLSLLEDLSDTMDGLSGEAGWKKKYEDNDREWRERYQKRFFEGDGRPSTVDVPQQEERKPPSSFEELFKEAD